MGVKITGAFDTLQIALRQDVQHAARAARDQMMREAIKIADLAHKMAPVDVHDLGQAIRADLTEDTLGCTKYSVYVADELNGVDIRDFAARMHELLGVTDQLGPESLAKQATQSEIVGGKFLERALKAREEPMVGAITEAVRGSLEK